MARAAILLPMGSTTFNIPADISLSKPEFTIAFPNESARTKIKYISTSKDLFKSLKRTICIMAMIDINTKRDSNKLIQPIAETTNAAAVPNKTVYVLYNGIL